MQQDGRAPEHASNNSGNDNNNNNSSNSAGSEGEDFDNDSENQSESSDSSPPDWHANDQLNGSMMSELEEMTNGEDGHAGKSEGDESKSEGCTNTDII